MTLWTGVEKQREYATKKLTFQFFFLLMSGYFSFLVSILSSWYFHHSPIVRKIGGPRPALRRPFAWLGYILSTPSERKEFFYEVSFARNFRNTRGIACMVTCVWVIPIPMYFNCCPFFLDMLNYSPPYGEQIILISRNGNLLFITTWILSSSAGRGRSVSFIHGSAAKV